MCHKREVVKLEAPKAEELFCELRDGLCAWFHGFCFEPHFAIATDLDTAVALV